MNLNILAIVTTMKCMTLSKLEYQPDALHTMSPKRRLVYRTQQTLGASSVFVTLYAQVCSMYGRDKGSLFI